ncbi:hypothetical protein BKA24_001762 [Microbacterium marinum]|uniref:Uncharacterized protein n=1 Tax=Microbacterium marinum TaxID=421115 RepID=A0A7W7BSU8_9MICO|nr:hypothetical protein [Microbacterium marinum]MBB4667053.1 hypothetical protein [Microbacterium marinum]
MIANTIPARFQECARHAVGSAMLRHVSPGGGSYGPSIDPRRAEEIARSITGEELHALLTATAREAVRDAEREARFILHDALHEVRQLATRSDSLSMSNYADALAERLDTREEASSVGDRSRELREALAYNAAVDRGEIPSERTAREKIATAARALLAAIGEGEGR